MMQSGSNIFSRLLVCPFLQGHCVPVLMWEDGDGALGNFSDLVPHPCPPLLVSLSLHPTLVVTEAVIA